MGRLTDNILAVLGVKPSDRVTASGSGNPSAQMSNPPSVHSESTNLARSSEKDSNEALTESDELEILPDKQNCLQCKLVGVGVAVGGSSYIIYKSRQNILKLKGPKKVAYIIFALSQVGILTTLGAARIFDFGYFDPANKDKTTDQLVQEDVDKLSNLAKQFKDKVMEDVTHKK